MKIKKGDLVKVIAGKDKGKEGAVERVYPNQEKVLIANINLYKRHLRKSQEMPEGGIVALPRPLHISNVMLIDPKSKKITRVGFQIKNGKKSRIAKVSKTELKN